MTKINWESVCRALEELALITHAAALAALICWAVFGLQAEIDRKTQEIEAQTGELQRVLEEMRKR